MARRYRCLPLGSEPFPQGKGSDPDDQYFQVNASRAVRPGAGITPKASGSR